MILRYAVGFFLRTMILIYFFCPDIPTTAEEREVKDLLMTIPNIGNLYVKKEGDCAKFTWQITWLSRTGDLPEATVSTRTALTQQALGVLKLSSRGHSEYSTNTASYTQKTNEGSDSSEVFFLFRWTVPNSVECHRQLPSRQM